MSISQSRYINIESVVGGVAPVPVKQLGALVISNNILIPSGKSIDFASASAVGTYFGTSGEEYARALFYFGFISKNGTQPQNLTFWNWNNDTATPDYLFGGTPIATLATFNAFTSGSDGELNLTMGGFTHTLTGIDLAGAGSLAAVASDIQTAIQAYTAGGTAWTAATVSYVSATGTFNLVSGLAEADIIAIAAASAHDLAAPLGWLASNAVLSNGTAAQTLTANLNQLISYSNNFGSFCFCTAYSTQANILAAATWNYALSPNNQFLLTWAVSTTNAATWQASVANLGGQAGGILSPQTGSYIEMEPMMVFDATNYNARNSVQNYEFYSFNDTASVTTDPQANTYDTLRLNYYGQTQSAGVNLSFYQQGVISGGQITDPADINVYCNEIWLKASITASFFNLLLAFAEVPANTIGLAMANSTLQTNVNQALFNGTISVGKPLNTQQQLYITNASGSSSAWQQVQNIGYWYGVQVVSYINPNNNLTQWKIIYTLIYSKNDVIRFVQGTDVLI